ncbi:unnamed protein product, partial [Allacma fusca]
SISIEIFGTSTWIILQPNLRLSTISCLFSSSSIKFTFIDSLKRTAHQAYLSFYSGEISLASIGRGEGRASPPDDSPPKKKPRVSSNMQTQQATNGTDDSPIKSNGITNGVHADDEFKASPVPSIIGQKANEDVVRIIGQHLIAIGLTKSAEVLMEESGCRMDHPVAAKFRNNVMKGDWIKAHADLQDLKTLLENPDSLVEMQFLLLEQKYLEQLEEGRVIDALSTLRYELTPLNHRTSRVHQLSAYIMCATPEEVREQAHWKGKESRSQLMEQLQQFLPPSIMLPPRRLETLLRQSIDWQTERCPYHNSEWHDDISLVVDHVCTKETFPSCTLQILNDHSDEVWFCRFSPDGTKLAT